MVCEQDDMQWMPEGLEKDEDEETLTDAAGHPDRRGPVSIDEARAELNRDPWGVPITSDPLWASQTGVVPLASLNAQGQPEPQAGPQPVPGQPPLPGQPGGPPALVRGEPVSAGCAEAACCWRGAGQAFERPGGDGKRQQAAGRRRESGADAGALGGRGRRGRSHR